MVPAAAKRSIRVAVAAVLLLAVSAGAWLIARGPHNEFATLSGHKNGAFSLVLSPDSTRVASGGGDGAICLWDVASKRQTAVLTGHTGKVLALAWSPDGAMLASGGADKSVRWWDAKTGENKGVKEGLPYQVLGLTYSSDGKLLAAAVERDVYIWDGDIYTEPRRIHAHKLYISGLAFRPGSHELVTFGCDKTVSIWNADTKELIAKMPGPTGHCHGLSMSADGKTVACIGGGRVHFYDLERRVPLEIIEPHARTLYGIAYSPDMRLLALGSEDKVVVIWDIAAKKERCRLRGHRYAVGPMAFLPDSRTLVSSSYDSTLKMWKVE